MKSSGGTSSSNGRVYVFREGLRSYMFRAFYVFSFADRESQTIKQRGHMHNYRPIRIIGSFGAYEEMCQA